MAEEEAEDDEKERMSVGTHLTGPSSTGGAVESSRMSEEPSGDTATTTPWTHTRVNRGECGVRRNWNTGWLLAPPGTFLRMAREGRRGESVRSSDSKGAHFCSDT